MKKVDNLSPCSEPTVCRFGRSALDFQSEGDCLIVSPFRSSWPSQQEDPKLPRARRTSMRMIESDAAQLKLRQPRTLPHGSTKSFLPVYLKLSRLVYFVEMATHWFDKYVKVKCMDGTVCFLCS